ncbi:MAG: hypothetical protein ACOYCA_02685 [Eggerthellaceae bacterium]
MQRKEDETTQKRSEAIRFLSLEKPRDAQSFFQGNQSLKRLLSAAICIGVVLFCLIAGPSLYVEASSALTVSSSLSRSPARDSIPDICSLMGKDADSIKSTLSENGDRFIEGAEVSGGISLIKVPDGQSEEEASNLHAENPQNLSLADTLDMISGSYEIVCKGSPATNIGLHYADYDSKSIATALDNAREKEGFSTEEIISSGEDETGNTYIMGRTSRGKAVYTWRISAVPLSSIYPRDGIPEDAVYVGIRVSA